MLAITLFLQMTRECEIDSDDLSIFTDLPSGNLQETDLHEIYKSTLILSANFRYMSQDWREGRDCSTRNLTNQFEK